MSNGVKRIFIALGTSEELQKEVEKWEQFHTDWPVRWVRGKNLHITLLPPWYEKNVGAAINKLKTLEEESASFKIGFDKIEFGPDPRRRRLIWATGEMPSEMIALRDRINTALNTGINSRSFLLHLTLARFAEENFHVFPVKTLSEKINWQTEARSFSLIESRLLPSGAEYEILREFII